MYTKKPERYGSPRSGSPPSRPTASQIAEPRPAVTARGSGDDATSVIGVGLIITGNLECKGELQVEGEVQGDIQAQRVVIGEQARIIGALIAVEVVVHGSVQGSIRGNAVTFQASSRVEGDVFHKSLTIELGAFFEGKSHRSDDPMSVPRTTAGVPPPTA